jgi:hypothetical protein
LTPRAQQGSDIDLDAAKQSLTASIPKDASAKVVKEHHNTILRARAMVHAAKGF